MISIINFKKLYGFPFYFQAVQVAFVIQSGVRFFGLAAPQVIGTVLAGGLAATTGYYVSNALHDKLEPVTETVTSSSYAL